MPPDPDLVALARAAAAAHGLDPALICAICEQESAWNPWAFRYEPAFFTHYIQPMVDAGTIPAVPGISAGTEARARAFSWGLMQVMGEVAREHGFIDASLASICNPATAVDVGCRVFAAKLDAANGDTNRALQLWNGGGNPNYAAQVLARVPNYQQGLAATP
jgi:soluble lytic murein transglycosylase-like protein